MSLFGMIKNAIFGSHPETAAPSGNQVAPQPSTAPSPTATGAGPGPGEATTSQGAALVAAPIDVSAILTKRAAAKGQKLNWETSIVDLMKVVDLDPTLENRKALAKELGYTGNTQDSAAMNIWLHKQVMEKLAESGGKVPDSLRLGH